MSNLIPRFSTIKPAKPTLTEANLPDQKGKVFIVTGGTSGVGKELSGILYQRNAKVYIAARSQDKYNAAEKEIKDAHPESTGELLFLKLVLDDLTGIKASADDFLAKESKIDVLFLNAGVMIPAQGSKTTQGYELQQGTNNLGHFLFAKLLTPTLVESAKTAPKNSVRIVWVSSSAADFAPKPAIDFDNMDYAKDESRFTKYARSKAGNAIHSCEFSRRYADSGVISLALNPGNLRSELQRHITSFQRAVVDWMLYPPKNGAYTELFAGLSDTIDEEDNGGWLVPFGKVEPIRADLAEAEIGKKYWEWSEEQVKQYC
ncbi:hypothetical protein VHEMI07309 [[Torrubiella] hemipterigena]|uniref:Short-chain dehydrogenase n=1 Tax=[Torrubiella] hemipterigena TaxID=1531966 RepID=A0A0A1TMP7_9HYPO|nr:hypothetical protein VHEMI07309 [[Torrubiella] hemipterigena]